MKNYIKELKVAELIKKDYEKLTLEELTEQKALITGKFVLLQNDDDGEVGELANMLMIMETIELCILDIAFMDSSVLSKKEGN